jgi:hypothetical protein
MDRWSFIQAMAADHAKVDNPIRIIISYSEVTGIIK